MRLPLRYFLVLSILVGGVAMPVGWRSYQKKWKADEIERLRKARQRWLSGRFLTYGLGLTTVAGAGLDSRRLRRPSRPDRILSFVVF